MNSPAPSAASAPAPRLDAVFLAVSDPTRRAVLSRLAAREESVSELARPFAMSLPAFGKHLNILQRAGLIEREKRGRTHYCRLNAAPMREAAEWMAFYKQFWEARLDELGRFLAENP